VAEWALDRGARRTALAFQEASALCWPDNGRCALAVGRAYRTRGLLKDAERWLRRARSLTLWDRDWEAHALAVNTLGMVCWHEGASGKALRHLHRALRITRRYKFRKLEGEILHNLLVVAITSDDANNVEQYAAAAFERYLPDHHRIPALAYDLAYYWLMRGNAASALAVFTHLLAHFSDPHQQIQVLAATARAAGLRRQPDLFDRAWAQACTLIGKHGPHVSVAPALLDLALGAAHLGRFADARTACRMALHTAEEQSQLDVVTRADAYMTEMEKDENPDALTGYRAGRAMLRQDRLTERLIEVLSGGTGFASR
jgi:tetratricopeptide (TPR) repeat protein